MITRKSIFLSILPLMLFLVGYVPQVMAAPLPDPGSLTLTVPVSPDPTFTSGDTGYVPANQILIANCFSTDTCTEAFNDFGTQFLALGGTPAQQKLVLHGFTGLYTIHYQVCLNNGSGSCVAGSTSVNNGLLSIQVGPVTPNKIFSVIPYDGENEGTSTSVIFGATGYINPDDFISGSTKVVISYSNGGIDSAQLVGPAAAKLQQPDSQGVFVFTPTSAGPFTFSTTTSVQTIGNYNLQTSITNPQYSLFGISLFTVNLVATSTRFVMATSTAFGTLQQKVQDEYNQLVSSASTTIDTTVCNPISGNFSVIACGTVVFGFPTSQQLAVTYGDFQNNVATHAPWGYFTRFFSILTYTGTTTFQTYTANIFLGPNGTTTVMTVDPNDIIAGAGSVINNIKDPENGMGIQEIMEPYVLLLVGLAVFFTIMADLLGSHRHNQHPGMDSRK